MTRNQAFESFVIENGYESVNVLKARIKDGKESKTTIRCYFIDYIDTLARGGLITEKQRCSWCCPSWLY